MLDWEDVTDFIHTVKVNVHDMSFTYPTFWISRECRSSLEQNQPTVKIGRYFEYL